MLIHYWPHQKKNSHSNNNKVLVLLCISDLFALLGAVRLGLVLARPLLPAAVAEVEDGAGAPEQVELLLGREVEDVEGLVRQPHLLLVVHVVHRELALRDVVVRARVLLHQQLAPQLAQRGRQQLVEDVVVPLGRLLEGHSRLLQQIRLDVGARDLASRAEVNTNEFALFGDDINKSNERIGLY